MNEPKTPSAKPTNNPSMAAPIRLRPRLSCDAGAGKAFGNGRDFAFFGEISFVSSSEYPWLACSKSFGQLLDTPISCERVADLGRMRPVLACSTKSESGALPTGSERLITRV